MRLKRLLTIVYLVSLIGCQKKTQEVEVSHMASIDAIPWTAHWISTQDSLPKYNAWLAFRKSFEIKNNSDTVLLRMAVDSKYWLYLNGERIVFEGGLKRGPTPKDTYFDEVDLSGKLNQGDNTLAILVWYFGKEGMSHKSSGSAGLIAELFQGNELKLQTDASWKAIPHPAYIPESGDPQPNWRLPESNIVFDAQKDLPKWTLPNFVDTDWPTAKTVGKGGSPPWHQLIKRPIPFWKDNGLRSYENHIQFPFTSTGDTIVCELPYNAHITPYLNVKSTAGKQITMLTDHYRGGSAYNMRGEYITTNGEQTYESVGWINGEKVYYVIPKGITVLDLKYRETGYHTEFSGNFECDDDFYNRLWQKALRTLYVTMRDTYMDCPDRERAQWWGDVVLESGEAFYALDRDSDALTKKGILELTAWQRPDSTLFSPIPAGNWDKELPTQMLSSIGLFGFWNYYWHTGDTETISKVYPSVGDYLSLWKLKPDGSVHIREGGWTWGDWGENKDLPLLFNTQYYMALDSYQQMSRLLGKKATADSVQSTMYQFKKDFNQLFWTGHEYRSREYKGKTDDRSQALAVVSGLADSSTYPHILQVLETEQHASPYMEKYVLEALFQMEAPNLALRRMKERFGTMVNYPHTSTLWEGWGIGAEGYGGGTTNHAWSGGGLTLLSQYVAGIAPTSAGYKTFQIRPQLGFLKQVHAIVPSIKGNIEVTILQEETFEMTVKIPKETIATIYIPATYGSVMKDGKKITHESGPQYHRIEVLAGDHTLTAH